MAVDEQRIAEMRDAARGLTGQLEAGFRATGAGDRAEAKGDPGLVHEHERDKAREVQAKEERAIAGLSEDGPVLAGGIRSRYGDLGHEGPSGESKKGAKRAAERAYREMLLASLLDQLQVKIDATVRRIGILEERLTAEFGEDFLEDNARMYLGDNMPERPPGLSDAEWNKLLQDKLADKMLNPDGSIKPEYAHLDIAKWLAEQRRLAELQARAEQVAEGAELLAQGGLSASEEAALRNSLRTETLAVLNRSETLIEDESLRRPFRASVIGAHDAQGQGASVDAEAELAAADLGIDFNNT